MAQGDYRLSAVLRGHDEDVRTVAFPTRRTLFSASRDSTVRRWLLTSSKPPAFDDTITLQASDWLNGLAYAGPSPTHPDGLIASAGRETFIYVKRPSEPTHTDPFRLLIGHANNVSCLAFSDDGSKLISGGWDAQVFVWDVDAGEVVAQLDGHTANVWAVFVYDAKLVLTACADKLIRVFDIKGKLLKTIPGHTDVVRCFCKTPPGHWSGAAFASAGNDQIIRLWSLDGALMGEMVGHESFIYSLAITPDGDIVSSSEDRTVRVWRHGGCIQTITHPAISIWTVAVCPETGDIASGASDKEIRIFSKDSSRVADAEALKAFEERNRMYAIPAQTTSQENGDPLNKENLPGPEALQTQVGQRDGQQLFIRENDGTVTAHLWSASSGQWNLIGTVVSGEGTSSQKKTYNGKEYDFLFDIDIEDGKPPLKLPYNLTESPWDAARKFLESNELPFSYYEQVANWISDNTKGANIGHNVSSPRDRTAPQSHDPWGMERRYRPGDAGSSSTSAQRKLPQTAYLEIVEGNPSNAINLIVGKAGQPQQPLGPSEVDALRTLSDQLRTKADPQPTPAQSEALLRVATQWPVKTRVPAVGVLALCAVSPSFVANTNSGNTTIFDTLAAAGIFEPHQDSANNVVHGLRLLANLFRTDNGIFIVDGNFDAILQAVRPFASQPESPAQFKALATLYLNFAVLLTTQAPSEESMSREARAEILLVDIGRMLECESPHASADEASLYRTLAALGTLLTLGDDFRTKVKGGVSGTLHFVSIKPATQTVKELIQEIRDELR